MVFSGHSFDLEIIEHVFMPVNNLTSGYAFNCSEYFIAFIL